MLKAGKLALIAILATMLAFSVTLFADDAASAADGAQVSNAKLNVVETNFDFGYIPQISKVGHSFTLYNVGSDDLKILNVKPGCGCTQAPLEKDLVGPGDSTRVELIFTSKKNYRGTMNKSAAVTTNDATYGTLRLRFSATINENPDSVGPVQLAPWDLNYNSSERNQEMVVNVKNVSTQPLNLQMVSAPYNYLDIDFPSGKLDPGASTAIKVRIKDSVKDDAFTKSFTFETGDEKNTRFTVPVVLIPSLTKAEHP